MTSTTVQLQQLKSIPLAVIRRQAKQSELSRLVPELCGLVWNEVRAQQAKAGRNVALYWDGAIRLDVTVRSPPAVRTARSTECRTAAGLITAGDRWAGQPPPPQHLPADLVAEGHTIPVARVQAMHEGKRRARARRTAGPGPAGDGPPAGDG